MLSNTNRLCCRCQALVHGAAQHLHHCTHSGQALVSFKCHCESFSKVCFSRLTQPHVRNSLTPSAALAHPKPGCDALAQPGSSNYVGAGQFSAGRAARTVTRRRLAVMAITTAALAEEVVPTAETAEWAAHGKVLEELEVGHSFTDRLPGDPDLSNERRQVTGALYSSVEPTPTGKLASLVAFSPEAAALIGLNAGQRHRQEFIDAMAGASRLPGSNGQCWANCYGGHQFGFWAGQLGDGRAISLGEVTGPGGRYELQLKGAGPTPYSRSADGRAVLRSSVREFIASEAMAALGIPTTRALSLVTTGDMVVRDMFYNGNPREEPGAVVCRMSKSFLRFGSFQLPSKREDDLDLVKQLADYTISEHFSHLDGEANKYELWLAEVVARTAHLVAAWQSVGFVHGVLNTDNMSILGETIDYGPYSFLERFDPAFTPNTSDLDGRRYSFRQQPQMCYWNCVQFATALLRVELLPQERAEEILTNFSDIMTEDYQGRMAAKLGLEVYNKDVAVTLLGAMYADAADFTNTFRSLSSVSSLPSDEDINGIPAALFKAIDGGQLDAERLSSWAEVAAKYRAALCAEKRSDMERALAQNAVNPAYVARNHVMQAAIARAEAGDYSEVNRLMNVLRRPFETQPDVEAYTMPAPRNGVRVGVELLSCSS